VPQRSAYDGRHRGRHRQDVTRPPRGSALPGAASAALALTATGAVILPGLGGSAVASEGDAATGTDTGGAPTTAAADPAPDDSGQESSQVRQLAAAANADLRQAAIAEDIREERQAAQERASRARERATLDARRKKLLAAAHRWVMPVETYRFTSGFGSRWGSLHAGDDFAAPVGTRVGSLSTGTVVFAGQQSGYGNKVEIRHWDGTVSWYAHMSSIAVRVGQAVTPGEKVGEVGNTGHSTGPHLHLEVHPGGGGPVDPSPWLRSRGLSI
jgi:murein DD-endopeptidase MepM/ murein hydrolase activator NlpD